MHRAHSMFRKATSTVLMGLFCVSGAIADDLQDPSARAHIDAGASFCSNDVNGVMPDIKILGPRDLMNMKRKPGERP